MPLNFFPPQTEVSEVRDDNNNILWEKPVSRTTTKGTTATFRNTRMAVNLLNRPNGTYTAESTGSVTVSHNITTVNVQFTSAWSIYKLTGDVNNTNIAVSLSDMKAKSTDSVLFKNGHTYIVKLFDSTTDYYDLQIANTTTNMTITDGVSFTPTEDFNALWTRMNADGHGSETGNKTFKIMIVEGTTAPTDYYPYFADTVVCSSARAYGKSPTQPSANKPIGKTTKAIGPVPFSSVEAYEEYKKSMAYGETPTHKSGVYPYGKAIGVAQQTSKSVLAGKYKTAQFMGKTVTKNKKPVLWGQYIPVEYIESNNAEYIDTGVNGSSGVSCDARVSWVNLLGDKGMLGARKSASDRIMLMHQYDSGHWCLSYGANNMMNLGTIASETVYHVEAKLSNGEQYLKVDGVTLVNNTMTGDVTNDFNLILFGCNEDGSPSYLSKSRVYSCKISTGGILARDFIPVKDVVNNVYGMFDRVTETFFGNAGTGAFTGGDEIKPVSYLESTGTEYIDTGVVGDNNTEVSVTAITPSSSTAIQLFGNNVNSSKGFTCNVGNSTGNVSRFGSDSFTGNNFVDATAYHTYRLSQAGLFVDGTSKKTWSAQTFTQDGTLYLLASLNSSGAANLMPNGTRIKSGYIKQNGVLVRDFIPVKVGNTGMMLDLVEWKLYGDASGQ